jgi:hypothetical protein
VAKFQVPFNSKTRRYRIFLVFISLDFDEEGKKSYLALKDTSLGKPKVISLTRRLIVEGTQAWTNEDAKELMVNETSLAPRKVVVDAHNHNNPLKQWEDAIWYYKWVELDTKPSHCICLVVIPIIVVGLVL